MPNVFFCFLTQEPIQNQRIGKSFFRLIQDELNGASLGKYGATEPLSQSFKDGIDGACEFWEQGKIFFWTDRRTKGFGSIFHRTSRKHSNVKIYFDAPSPDSEAWVRFLRSVSSLLTVDFSSLHISDKCRTDEDEVYEGIKSYDLKVALPTVAWASCFGKPYLELIGRERFQLAGFEVLESVDEELFFCQLTADPFDYINNYDSFRSRQDDVKSKFGLEYFLGASQPIAPDFFGEN